METMRDHYEKAKKMLLPSAGSMQVFFEFVEGSDARKSNGGFDRLKHRRVLSPKRFSNLDIISPKEQKNKCTML